MNSLALPGFRSIAIAISKAGVDFDALLNELAGPSELDLYHNDRLSLALAYQIINVAVERTGNPDLGLDAYAHLHLGILGGCGYPIITSPDLGTALERLTKYFPLLMSGGDIVLESDELGLKITGVEEVILDAPVPRGFIDACASLLLGLLHWLVPQENIMPLRVELPYPEPVNTLRLKERFGSHLVFDSRHVSLTFAAQVLDLKLITANRALEAIHCEYADAQLHEQLKHSHTAQVYRLLFESMTRGVSLSLEGVAVQLGMSRRSVQNMLEKDGTNFSALRDECRQELARNLLLHSPRSVQHIATTLGFYEPSGFHKACLRWFGITPGQFRDQRAQPAQ